MELEKPGASSPMSREGIWETGREKVAFAADGAKGAGGRKAELSCAGGFSQSVRHQ